MVRRAMLAVGKGARGFTLVEMLAVLAVIGLIAGLGFPRMQAALRQHELRLTVSSIGGALRQARAEALRSQSAAQFHLGADGRHYGIAAQAINQGHDTAVPASITVSAPPGGIRFFGDGSSSGGRVVAASGSRRVQFDIAAETGLFAVSAG